MTSVENKENASEVETITIIDDVPVAKKGNISSFFSPPRKKAKQDSIPLAKLPKNQTPVKCGEENNSEKDAKQSLSDNAVITNGELVNTSKKHKSPVNKETSKNDKSPKTSPKNATPAKNNKTPCNTPGSGNKTKNAKPDVPLPFPKLSKEDALKESEKEIQILKAREKEREKDISNDVSLSFPKLSKEEAQKELEKEIQILKTREKEQEDVSNDTGGVVNSTPDGKLNESTEKKTSPLSKEERQRIKEEKEAQKVARMKEAEEKRKKREEEKAQKQAEKEKRENERKEKERLREEEKRKREEERKLKEEEKLKKEEQLRIEKEKKEAEKEKKELERKLKEDAKRLEEEKKKQEDDAVKKKKVKEANHFRSFFTQKKDNATKVPDVESYQRFKPFQLKPDMILAPVVRNNQFNRDLLDKVLENEVPEVPTYLKVQAQKLTEVGRPKYISRRKKRHELEEELAAKKKECQKKERVEKPANNSTIDLENLVVINDDSNSIEDEDTEDEADLTVCDNKYLYIAKLLQFSENTRPSYYGTWRKKSVHISGKKPFALDTEVFNYDIDSDEEWIDEPGENLSDAADEDEDEEKEKEKEKETEDDQDGFFVPHGYLSDDEGIEEEADDEEDGNAETIPSTGVDLNEDRKLKLKACTFEQEFQKKVKHRKVICVGITYAHEDVNNINPVLRSYVKVALVKPVHEKQAEEENDVEDMDESSPTTAKNPQMKTNSENNQRNIPQTVPEEAMPLLIRFLHGNVSSLPNMLKKFRDYWTAHVKECGGTLRSNISKRQLERKIQTIASRVYYADIGKMCYLVNDDVVNMYELKDLKIGEGLPDLNIDHSIASQEETDETPMDTS